jgi:hypothetical protein
MSEKFPTPEEEDSQIERGFEVLGKRFLGVLNRPMPKDPEKQKAIKQIDTAFESCQKFANHLGQIVDIADDEVFNIIGNAFSYNSAHSVDEVRTLLRVGSDLKEEDVEYVGENQWKIKNEIVLKKIGEELSSRYRQLYS